MKFLEFYRLLTENPEHAFISGGVELTFMDHDAYAFGLTNDGKIHIGGVEDVPMTWANHYTNMDAAMSHSRLYGINVAGKVSADDDPHWGYITVPYQPHVYYKTLGRAWCREGILYMSFWRKEPSMNDLKVIVKEFKKDFEFSKVRYQHEGLSDEEWENMGEHETTPNPELARLAELERMMHIADPGQKIFLRRGIEDMKRKINKG